MLEDAIFGGRGRMQGEGAPAAEPSTARSVDVEAAAPRVPEAAPVAEPADTEDEEVPF